MKGLWIRVEAHEVDSVRVAQLAENLGIKPVTALGHLTALGGAVGEHTDDGHIANVSNATIERWARWDGKQGAFGAAVREILQDGDGFLDDWRESMGQLIEKRARDRKRKAPDSDIPRNLHGNSTEIPRKEVGDSAVTERNGTEPKTKRSPRQRGNGHSLDILAVGELVNRIRAMATKPNVGDPVVPRAHVEALGTEVVRAYDAVGGSGRFVGIEPKTLSFLIREFGQALESAGWSAEASIVPVSRDALA